MLIIYLKTTSAVKTV